MWWKLIVCLGYGAQSLFNLHIHVDILRLFFSSSVIPFVWQRANTKSKARPPVASDVGRAHPATRMGSPPTPSSLRSASTASSSTRSSPQQQQQVPQNHQPTMSVAAAATAALANGTSPSSSSGGGPPPPSRQSEPKDLKYRETTPSAKKKVNIMPVRPCTC